MFGLSVRSFLEGWIDKPEAARRAALDEAILDDVALQARMRAALPEAARQPFDDLVAALGVWKHAGR